MKELFNKHQELMERYKQLANIVQNDWKEFPQTTENMIEYNKLHTELILEMNKLQNDISFTFYNF